MEKEPNLYTVNMMLKRYSEWLKESQVPNTSYSAIIEKDFLSNCAILGFQGSMDEIRKNLMALQSKLQVLQVEDEYQRKYMIEKQTNQTN